MFLVKPCPACGKKLRFPINRGKINVKCSCSYSFIIDPDNPEIYKNAQFDLKIKNRIKRNFKKKFTTKITSFSLYDTKLRIINSVLNYKYNLQNYKILPAGEQIKIIISLFIIFTSIVIIIYLIIHLLSTADLKTVKIVI